MRACVGQAAEKLVKHAHALRFAYFEVCTLGISRHEKRRKHEARNGAPTGALHPADSDNDNDIVSDDDNDNKAGDQIASRKFKEEDNVTYLGSLPSYLPRLGILISQYCLHEG
ncbi:uncharacterized protein RAG0_02161 [Rhynchosporium agropyri]|uniref:Uncharacterized protein n=1 Tax=Rhynchosporium agropyri TaxID=914238 RepID=A0A1E1K0D2_9HELO|nr:uncharacterized protein RAG0_02161 [Rhynchosporium agropyri]